MGGQAGVRAGALTPTHLLEREVGHANGFAQPLIHQLLHCTPGSTPTEHSLRQRLGVTHMPEGWVWPHCIHIGLLRITKTPCIFWQIVHRIWQLNCVRILFSVTLHTYGVDAAGACWHASSRQVITHAKALYELGTSRNATRS